MTPAVSANDQKGSLFCWLGLIGNAIVAGGILFLMFAAWLDMSLPVSREAVRPIMLAALGLTFVSWLVSAGAYKLRSVRVDSDALGITLGLVLMVPVGLFLLLAVFAITLAPMG